MGIRKKASGKQRENRECTPHIVRRYFMKEESGQHCQMMHTSSKFSYQKVMCTSGRSRFSEVVGRETRLQIGVNQSIKAGNGQNEWRSQQKKAGRDSFPEGKAHLKLESRRQIRQKNFNNISCKVPYFKCDFCVISTEEVHKSSPRASSQGNEQITSNN